MRPQDIKIGMKVKAVWKPASERKGDITDIRYFRPWEPVPVPAAPTPKGKPVARPKARPAAKPKAKPAARPKKGPKPKRKGA